MSGIVVKFGGSTLKNPEDISRVIGVIKRYPPPVVVVVSALSGVTNDLAQALQVATLDKHTIEKLKNRLLGTHLAFAGPYVTDETECEVIAASLRNEIEKLGNYLLGIHLLGEVPAFAVDMVLSFGERLSSLLISSILKHMGIHCELRLPEEMRFMTDGEYGGATVDLLRTESGVRRSLSGASIFIVPGFYGISPEGKITTFGRGGSDYSAAVIARCIGSPSIDLWKDVSGFMTADPKLVESASCIGKLTYQEAAELSYFGARILHPRSFEPLLGRKVPIRLFNINDAAGSLKPLTVIDDEGFVSDDIVKSITYSDDLGILILRGPGVGIKPGIMAKVTARLNDARINIKSIITAQTCINILLARSDLSACYELIRQPEIRAVDKVSYQDDVSLIAVVGQGMLDRPGVWSRMLSAVARSAINIRIISAGASDVAAYLIINRQDRDTAIHAIHKEFFS